MKILFTSSWGSSVPLAMLCEDVGHDVLFFIKDKKSDVGDGFVNKTDDLEKASEWADLIICDDTGWGKKNDDLRSKGKPVIGSGEKMDKVEEDRGMGQKLFKAAGMEILESQEFKSIQEAVAYVQSNPKRYVIKVSGNVDDKSMTYVGESQDGIDVPPVLEHMESKMKGVSGVEIQEHVEGLEVAIGGFFNGEDFMSPIMINFEHKKLMPGPTPSGIGCNTGEMGTVGVWMDKDFDLYRKTLGLMVRALKMMDYRGYYDINCIIKDEVIYPLEATCRFGWPTLPLQLETMKGQDLGELFYGMATGTKDSFETTNPYSLCVVIGVPPMPYMNDEIFEKYSKDMPILLRDSYELEGLYPGESKLVDDQWIIAGTSGCALVCAGQGTELEEARNMAYDRVENIMVANKMYRVDIGEHIHKMLIDLMDMGLLGGVKDAVGG